MSQADPGAVGVLETLAGERLPEGAALYGAQDSDGDGRDDDGQVEVKVGNDAACVTLPSKDSEGDVSDGTCE